MVVGRFGSLGEADFSRTYKLGKKWHCGCAVVFFAAQDCLKTATSQPQPAQNPQPKFAVVVSKKYGKAHERNRAKRRLRAAFWGVENGANSNLAGGGGGLGASGREVGRESWRESQKKLRDGNYVFVVKSDLKEMDFSRICKEISWALKRLGAFEN